MLPEPDCVQLYAIRLDQSASAHDRCWQLLSEGERDRADRFANPQLAKRWAAGRAGLKSILAAYRSVSPLEIVFTETTFGKPGLAEAPLRPQLNFNLSHSGDLAVVAVSGCRPVGVDLERVRDIKDWRSVARRFFSSWENLQLKKIAECEQQRAFFLCWTRKEAVIKGTGEGLQAQLDSFDVSIAMDELAAVMADRSVDRRYSGWQLKHFSIDQQYVGAVAARGSKNLDLEFRGFWKIEKA